MSFIDNVYLPKVDIGIVATAAAAVVTLIVTYLPENPPYFICPVSIISGLYATAFIAVLNSRLRSPGATQSTSWNNTSFVERDFTRHHALTLNILASEASSHIGSITNGHKDVSVTQGADIFSQQT